MEYDEQLKEYGILATATNPDQVIIKDDVLSIISAQIDKIDFQILQNKKIKKIHIFGSEIQYIYFYFNKDTTIDIDFECCNFKNQVIARGHKFNNTIAFTQCIFETIVDFSGTTFKCQTTFLNSIFKAEARFINTKFLVEQSDNSETIENNFRETSFEGNTFFDRAEFKGRVNFGISRFKAEASFINTKFLAEQGNGEIIENNFRQSIFEGNTFFSRAEFKGRVSFGISRFKAETRFIKTKFLAKQGNGEIENDFRESIFEGKVSFSNVEFQGRVSFGISRFKDEVSFVAINLDKCIFNHTEFNKTKFIKIDYKNAETYTFRNSTFKDTLSFENTNISKLAFDNVVFNGIVTFNKTNSNKPSFINCTFSNQFNIEHKYIQYSYEEIEKIIEEKIEKYKSSLNYRDLFRKLKSNRIAHHNLIDASELHSQELYAREFELKHKGNKTIKEHIEKWQLRLYRKLCDHHTDLLLNLKWLIITIGLFACLYFIAKVFQNINILNILSPLGVFLSILSFLILFCMCYCKCIKIFDFFAYLSVIPTLWVICYKPKLIFGIRKSRRQ